ncbi:glycosyltransferase sugar-binding region containing DXD domain-containing protein [Colletotrichum graminicola M1.001]|uniref:Glycosyltransferase sugar-binding region containing DXD domain-containing protein n=1 Tax=Colletotrichum graminicola (strain M1.001 / M2 / FGSC 10212) TaxID=645133 RepID=E3QDG2_COLGM|nr:glycosyltransferase sugar-binding region containing DXD domain-containing protein [Colletotrichum graminicola M1.001]EFQ28934.1 glycosyltransferase sugar-binding region containing DXD domain-containing protein [Colletotrichum graminicola M1.001]
MPIRRRCHHRRNRSSQYRSRPRFGRAGRRARKTRSSAQSASPIIGGLPTLGGATSASQIPTVTSSDLFTSMKDQIVKADFLRYLILLREGGVWADIDVYPRQPLSKWIPEKFLDSINMVIGIENDHHKKPI